MTTEVEKDSNGVLPECKVPATVNPNGMLRFRISRSQAEQLLQQTQANFKTTDDDELVTFTLNLDKNAYEEMVAGLQQLETQLPAYGAKQVNLTHDPEYVISVLLSEDQVQNGAGMNESDVAGLNDDDVYSQQFQLSKKAAFVVLKQLESALGGESDPVKNLDMTAIKREY